MNQLDRNLYRLLYRKCIFIDKNPSLKNFFISNQKIIDYASNDQITNFIAKLNDGKEFYSPKTDISMTSLLNKTFRDNIGLNNIKLAFDGLKQLNKVEQFHPQLKYDDHNVTKRNSLEILDRLDPELLVRGGMAFIQHPISFDIYRMGNKIKSRESRKIMIGLKPDRKSDVTMLITLNKPSNTNNESIPKLFLNNNVFHGGAMNMGYHSMTTNENCHGIPILNNKLYFNPDKHRAKELVTSKEANAGDFRFFVGFEFVNDSHLESVMQRNKYIAVNLESFQDKDLLFDILWNNKYIHNDMYQNIVSCLDEQYADSWLKIPESISDTPLFNELYENRIKSFK